MADYLTDREGVWHFVRKVPLAYREHDRRGLVRQSTKIAVITDRHGRKAGRVAKGFNDDLETFWRGLASGDLAGAQERYDE
ncbi:MAG: integrase, partial [Tardiphaga sp.]|nr:integrase [Tardiphaga sp.]